MEPLTFTALGTQWWVELFDTVAQKRRTALSRDIAALLQSIEGRFSRFRDDSLVSQLNTHNTIYTTDPDCRELLQLGKTLYQQTNGVFNILIGDHLSAKGYDATYSFTEKPAPTYTANPVTDITIAADTITIHHGSIDLGGIGKGWAIDKIAALLNTHNISSFLINGGGDMYGTHEHGNPIEIYLEHPTNPGIFLGTTTLYNQGFAASSPHKRTWKSNTTTHTHIVSSTALVADASFVIAPNALWADVLATISLLITDTSLTALTKTMHATTAQYHLATQQLTYSTGFPFHPL